MCCLADPKRERFSQDPLKNCENFELVANLSRLNKVDYFEIPMYIILGEYGFMVCMGLRGSIRFCTQEARVPQPFPPH